jgi:hypothetical protein
MIGEWLAKSFDSDSLNITYRTSASKLPIWRPKPVEYHRLKLHQKGGWSSPILTTLHPTSTFLVAPSPELEEEGEIIKDIIGSGMA